MDCYINRVQSTHTYIRWDKYTGHGIQSLFWPWEEPINVGTIHHTWKVYNHSCLWNMTSVQLSKLCQILVLTVYILYGKCNHRIKTRSMLRDQGCPKLMVRQLDRFQKKMPKVNSRLIRMLWSVWSVFRLFYRRRYICYTLSI